jgi:predicted RNase H-like HicB family nuclease
MRYTIIVERGLDGGYGAYVPDLPGCAAAADSESEVLQLIRKSIALYIDELKARGEHVPAPASKGVEITV